MTEIDNLLLFSAKDKLRKMNHLQEIKLIEKLEKENAELKAKLRGFENGEGTIYYCVLYRKYECVNLDKWELAE